MSSNSSNSPDQSQQNQQPNATNQVASSSRVTPFYDRNISKYLGVTRIGNKDAFVATAYSPGSISWIPRAVYLGTYDKEEDAARAYDLATLKLIGPSAPLNYPLKDYPKAIEKMANMSAEDVVGYIRSAASARGKTRFRGVFKNEQTGKWQARIVDATGKEHIFGAFDTEEEAAVAYDVASVREKGFQAITNYSLRCYNIQSILNSEKMKQQQQIYANVMRQQAANANRIWQQAMELQAINARKNQQKERVTEAGKRFLALQKQHPDLRLTLGTGGANLEKPKARYLGLGDQKNQPEGMRKFFKSWALKTARKELASGATKKFNHGEGSPFGSYEEVRSLTGRPKLYNFFAAKDEGQRVPPYMKWLKAHGLGFKRGNPKHYKNDPDIKGKAKVSYDV